MSKPRLTAAQRRERDALAMLGALVLWLENADLIRIAIEHMAHIQAEELRALLGGLPLTDGE